jgi:hypothetical protein
MTDPREKRDASDAPSRALRCHVRGALAKTRC